MHRKNLYSACAAVAALTMSLALDPIRDAGAPAPTLSLVTSPASMATGTGNASVIAQNATSNSITIVSVQLANPASGQALTFPQTTCLVGTILAPSQSCAIAVVAGKT